MGEDKQNIEEENKTVEDQTSESSGNLNTNAEPETGGNENKESKSSKTFTQEQVTKMMAREKSQGRNSVYRELGIDPKNTKLVEQFKAFVESQKTDEQKAAEKETEAQSKISEAELRAINAEAKAEAMMLGVKSQYVEDAVTLALSKLSDDTDLKTILGEFKLKYPIWFEEPESTDKSGKTKGTIKTGQKGTGTSVKEIGKSIEKTSSGLGARLAVQRRTTNKKSSYWG